MARVAQLEKTREAQAASLAQKEALIESQGNAILIAETTLTATNAEIEEGRRRIVGKCQD